MEDKLYWYAVRSSRNMEWRLKVLSRRFETEEEALSWAEFEKGLVSTNKNHTYTAIQLSNKICK